MKDSFQKVLPNLGKSSDMTNIHKEITIDNRIFLKGFKLETREEEVENIFKAYGDIVETKIIRDSFNGQSRGFGFVTFDSQQVAQEVLNKVQSLQIGDTEITVGPAKIRRLPPFGKPFRNRYPNDVQPSNFIPPHPQNQSHQPHYYSMPAYIVSPDGMFTWLPNNAAAPYQKFPYYPDASGGYYQQDNAANEHQSIINSDASNNNNNKINSIYDANKIDGTSSEIFVNSQSSPSTNGGGKYDLPSPNSSTSGSSPVTHKPPPAAVDQFKLSSSSGGGAPVFNPPPTTLQPTFVPVSSPQNGGGSSGELIHMNGSYIHPNGTFIPTTSHVTMFNNNSYLQHVSNNMNNNSSTINSSEMKHHQHHHHQQHPNFFYNGMVTCADRNIPAVSMGYPPVSCSASDMALLAAGFNNNLITFSKFRTLVIIATRILRTGSQIREIKFPRKNIF